YFAFTLSPTLSWSKLRTSWPTSTSRSAPDGSLILMVRVAASMESIVPLAVTRATAFACPGAVATAPDTSMFFLSCAMATGASAAATMMATMGVVRMASPVCKWNGQRKLDARGRAALWHEGAVQCLASTYLYG